MSRLLDPTVCPDCRAPLDRTARCTGCRLHLTGRPAARLWELMTDADRVIEQLRAQASPPSPAPESVAPRSRRSVPAFTVPVVLLSLGAVCLLVAAVVFVAVAWGSLGLTGRTLVLLGVTGLLVAAAAVPTRTGLRGAAETLWLVVGAMAGLDVVATRAAGLAGLDSLETRQEVLVLGAALLVLGASVAWWSRRTPAGGLYGVQVLAVAGAGLAGGASVLLAGSAALALAVAVPALAALAVVLRRPLVLLAGGLALLAGLAWLALAASGLERATYPMTSRMWWHDVRGWPLLVSSAYAGASAHVVRWPAPVRRLRWVATGPALLLLGVLLVSPPQPGHPTREAALRVAALLALSAVAAAAPRVWAVPAVLLGTVTAAVLGAVSLVQPLTAVDVGGTATVHLAPYLSRTAPWTHLALAASVAGLALAAPRRTGIARPVARFAAGSVLLSGLAVTVGGLEPDRWVAVATFVAGGVLALAATHRLRERGPARLLVGGGVMAYLAATALVLAGGSDLLRALAATALGLALAAVRGWLTAGASVLVGGYALAGWCSVLGLPPEGTAVVLASYAGVLLAGAGHLGRGPVVRTALETSAALVGTAAAVLAVGDPARLALALTITGAAVALATVTQDRGRLGWAATGVLGLATLVRAGAGVTAPELYTLPAALLLLGAGAARLRAQRARDSLAVLGSGLTLALVPSLLLALRGPVSVRGLLVGLGGLVALSAGARWRLAAPFAYGAVTVGLLAVRELEPFSAAVPRWVALGLAGMLLLAAGVTWEARMRDLRTAQRYLAVLR